MEIYTILIITGLLILSFLAGYILCTKLIKNDRIYTDVLIQSFASERERYEDEIRELIEENANLFDSAEYYKGELSRLGINYIKGVYDE